MINVPNWDAKRARYEQYWKRENTTPILHVTAPEECIIPYEGEPCRDRWFDCAYHVRSARNAFQNTYYGGDAYPYYLPDLGYDVATALLGLETRINEESSWALHQEKALSEFQDFPFNPQHPLFQKMVDAVSYYVEDAKNLDYIVGMIPFNTLYDGVSSLIGPDRLCMEMMDNPEEVHRVARGHFELFKKVYPIFEKLTNKYQGGSTNWLGVYSDTPWYYISDDFIVMLSEAFFEEFILETLEETVRFHPRTLFHLDGENAVRHLDAILQLKELTGVQVQATPFRQSAEFWVPYLQKIQAAGKNAWVEARHIDDLKHLISHLEPQGLFIKAIAETKDQAAEMEALIQRHYGHSPY